MKILIAACVFACAGVCFADQPPEPRPAASYHASHEIIDNRVTELEIVGLRVVQVPTVVVQREDRDCVVAFEDSICDSIDEVVDRVEMLELEVEGRQPFLSGGHDVDETGDDSELFVFRLSLDSIAAEQLAKVRELSRTSRNPFVNAINQRRLAALARELFRLEVVAREVAVRVADYANSPFYCDDEEEQCPAVTNRIVHRSERIELTSVRPVAVHSRTLAVR